MSQHTHRHQKLGYNLSKAWSHLQRFNILNTINQSQGKIWFTVYDTLHLCLKFSSVQFSPLIDLIVRRDTRFGSAYIGFQSFPAWGPCEQFWHRQRCPLFDVVYPEFSLPTTASPTLQGTLKDGFGEAVVVRDMSEPCKFLSLEKRKSILSNKCILSLTFQTAFVHKTDT